ncbi:DUF2249 domain-containing protein [Coraliomargarita sp. W4R53]
MSPSKMFTLDVRPLLQAGTEPMTAIMQAKAQLAPGQKLRLLTTFEPRPLYALFESDGYQAQPRQLETNHWEILFVPQNNASVPEQAMDFRGQPEQDWLEKALEAVSFLGREGNIVLHTSERPKALLAELNPATTDYDCEADGEAHWVITIWRL